jgi:hypothetical protein
VTISHVSYKLTFTVEAPEVTDKGLGHPLNPKTGVEPSSNIRSATVTSMVMSREARRHARVAHISKVCPQTPTVDADDSEAVAALWNMVEQCREDGAKPTSSNFDTVVRTQRGSCRGSSRLLEFFRSENHQPSSPSRQIVPKSPATQVNLPNLVSGSNCRSCRQSRFKCF